MTRKMKSQNQKENVWHPDGEVVLVFISSDIVPQCVLFHSLHSTCSSTYITMMRACGSLAINQLSRIRGV